MRLFWRLSNTVKNLVACLSIRVHAVKILIKFSRIILAGLGFTADTFDRFEAAGNGSMFHVVLLYCSCVIWWTTQGEANLKISQAWTQWLKIIKMSHSILRAKRATFTFWVDKSSLKMPKLKNSNATFLVIFKHRVWSSKARLTPAAHWWWPSSQLNYWIYETKVHDKCTVKTRLTKIPYPHEGDDRRLRSWAITSWFTWDNRPQGHNDIMKPHTEGR